MIVVQGKSMSYMFENGELRIQQKSAQLTWLNSGENVHLILKYSKIYILKFQNFTYDFPNVQIKGILNKSWEYMGGC